MAWYVAPLAGAWIEILIASSSNKNSFLSLLSRERGLKSYDMLHENAKFKGRSSRGSVD